MRAYKRASEQTRTTRSAKYQHSRSSIICQYTIRSVGHFYSPFVALANSLLGLAELAVHPHPSASVAAVVVHRYPGPVPSPPAGLGTALAAAGAYRHNPARRVRQAEAAEAHRDGLVVAYPSVARLVAVAAPRRLPCVVLEVGRVARLGRRPSSLTRRGFAVGRRRATLSARTINAQSPTQEVSRTWRIAGSTTFIINIAWNSA